MRHNFFKYIVLCFSAVALFLAPELIHSRTLPKMSVIVDSTPRKPHSVFLSLQYVNNYSSETKTVYFKKLKFEHTKISLPHLSGFFQYRASLDFPDTEYLHLQCGSGSFRVLLRIKLKNKNESGMYECVLDESDWEKLVSEPGTIMEIPGNLQITGETNSHNAQLVYHQDDGQVYIIIDNQKNN